MTETRLDADGLPLPNPNFEQEQQAAALAFFSGETDEEPVMHATDPATFRDLSARIPGLLVHSAGGVCPFQSEGTLHGYPYYFRYRSGHATLEVMDPHAGEDTASLFESLYSAGVSYGEDLAGWLDRDEFCDLMASLVGQLQRSPFLWEFPGQRVTVTDAADPDPDPETGPTGETSNLRFTATGDPETFRAWGHTPEEAYARLHETSPYLLGYGWTAEKQAEKRALEAISPVPSNHDRRIFPDPEPVFTVLPAAEQPEQPE